MRGDRAVAYHTRRLDGVRVPPQEPFLPPEAFALARELVEPELRRDLTLARDRIRRFHRKNQN